MVATGLIAGVDGDALREWATAVGTVGAAIFAGWAALTSRGEQQAEAGRLQVEAAREEIATAREQVDVARLAVQAQIQPVLVDEPLDLSAPETDYDIGGQDVAFHPGALRRPTFLTAVACSQFPYETWGTDRRRSSAPA